MTDRAASFRCDLIEIFVRIDSAATQACRRPGDFGVQGDEFAHGFGGQRGSIRQLDGEIFFAEFDQIAVELIFGVDVAAAFLALAHLEERRLGDVNVSRLNQRFHLAEEKRQQQRADVRTVHIGIGHDHHPVIARLGDVELFSETAADRVDQRLNFLVVEHFVLTDLFDVEQFAADRQNRLEFAVASGFRRTACRITLDDVKFAACGIAVGAVGKFPRQPDPFEQALAADGFTGLLRRFAGAGRGHRAGTDGLGDGRVLFEIGAEFFVDDRFDDAAHLGIAELGLGLPLELGIRHLDADDRRQPFAHVGAA